MLKRLASNTSPNNEGSFYIIEFTLNSDLNGVASFDLDKTILNPHLNNRGLSGQTAYWIGYAKHISGVPTAYFTWTSTLFGYSDSTGAYKTLLDTGYEEVAAIVTTRSDDCYQVMHEVKSATYFGLINATIQKSTNELWNTGQPLQVSGLKISDLEITDYQYKVFEHLVSKSS